MTRDKLIRDICFYVYGYTIEELAEKIVLEFNQDKLI